MFINYLEKVSINGSNQWLLVRGKKSNSPLILQIQAGPGLPMISEANTLQKKHHLENDFLVAYWDQRGCGKSFNKTEKVGSMNLNQLADDLISCTQYLLKKYKKERANLIGYSIGGTLSLLAAQKAGLFENIFLVGPDIHLPIANRMAMEFLVDQATKGRDKNALKQIDLLKKVQINDSKLFQKRARLIGNAGGIILNKKYNDIFLSAITNMLFTKEYKFADIIKTIRGMEFCQNALLPEFNSVNLYEKIKTINAAVHFMQGMKDAVAPKEIAAHFFEYLNCDSKSFTEFEHSAHMPHLEEPDKFAEVVKTKINKN